MDNGIAPLSPRYLLFYPGVCDVIDGLKISPTGHPVFFYHIGVFDMFDVLEKKPYGAPYFFILFFFLSHQQAIG